MHKYNIELWSDTACDGIITTYVTSSKLFNFAELQFSYL